MRERRHGPSRCGGGTRRSRRRWYDQRDERHRSERDRNERRRHDGRDGERDREHDCGRRRDLGCRRLRGVRRRGGASLPEGDDGIAARHPGDVGIESDPDVIFADDFETYAQASDLDDAGTTSTRTDVRIATESRERLPRDQALEFTVPQQDNELSNATDKILSPGARRPLPPLLLEFEPPYDVVGSSHNGSMISAHYFINGQATPGVPANGTNKFLVNLENWRGEAATASPGLLNVYIYHPEQRSQWGDHFFPNGDGDAELEPCRATSARTSSSRPGHHPRARPLVLLRVHAEGEHARASATAASPSGSTASSSRDFRTCAARRRHPEDRSLRPLAPHRLEPERRDARSGTTTSSPRRSYIGPVAGL